MFMSNSWLLIIHYNFTFSAVHEIFTVLRTLFYSLLSSSLSNINLLIMASSEDNLDSGMDYQEINYEENISVSNTVSHNDYYGKSSQLVSSAACARTLDPDIDLKTCEFDDLLSYLSNKMKLKNIRAIYHFLKGKNDEIEFRGANMYLEEILVRIVQNVEVLRSEKFAQSCALYCKLIIDLIKNALSNRIFMVAACIYKNEKEYLRRRVLNYKILIYKKLYYTSHYETQMQIFDGPTSIMSMSSTPPMSRSTSTDSLDSQRSNFDMKPSSNPFILHCLHLILNFVKDQTQLSLNFSGLSKSDTIYFHSVFSSAIDEKFDNGTLCKNVYRAIWEAVKIFSLKFDFRIRNLGCSLNTKSLLLEKRMKMSVTDDAGGTSHSRKSKRKLKKKEKNQAFVNQLPLDFINCCLKKMLKFLLDGSEASLIIPVCNPEEKKFVKNIINYIRSPAVRMMFSDEPRSIMEQLNELLDNRSNYRLRTSGKNKFGKNDVKFMKIPRFENRYPQQNRRSCEVEIMTIAPSENSPSQQSTVPCGAEAKTMLPPEDSPPRTTPCGLESNNLPPSEDLPPQESSTTCDVEATDIPPSEDSPPEQSQPCAEESVKISPSENSPRNKISRSWYPRGVTVPRNLGAIRKAYLKTGAGFQQSAHGHSHLGWDLVYEPPRLESTFHPAGIVNQVNNSEADPVLTEVMTKYGNSGVCNNKNQWVDSIGHQPTPKPAMPRGKDCRTDQLFQALSVPVQSEKARKMMLSMGWTGGALGARGNGITEPIMPHLNGGYGAGFGHKRRIQQNKMPKVITPVATLNVTPRIMATMTGTNRSAYTFREIFLSHLLDLLESTDDSTTLTLHPAFSRRDISFINNIMRNFAIRAKVYLYDDGQNLVNNIELHFKKDPEMLVTANISNSKKKIVLTKRYGLGKVCHSDEARCQRLANAEHITNNITEFMIHYGPLVYTQKSYDEMKFSVLYLLEILKLVKDKNLQELDVKMVITFKEKTLLRLGLLSINKNEQFRDKTPEIVLYSMIRKFMSNYTVNVKFTKELTKFTLFKEYLVPIMVAGADLTLKNAEVPVHINNDTGSDHDLAENDDQKNKIDNVKNDKMNEKNKTETDSINIEAEQKIVTTENNESDEFITTKVIDENSDDENQNKLTTSSSSSDYSTDEISISDQSGFTTNLDYDENEDTDVSDHKLSDDKSKDSDNHLKIQCDKLDLSAISETTLNVGLEEQSQSDDKSDVKIVCLTKNGVFSEDTTKFIQVVISHKIIKTKQLPLLMCHGVHSDALIYSCHTKKSYDWLLSTCIANQLTIFTKEVDKMALKINSYYEIYDKNLFDLLELYNKELSTKEWSVLKRVKMSDCLVFDVKMDKKSVKFILESKLSLYAGVDKVTFSIILE